MKNTPPTHTYVSCGKLEKAIIEYLISEKNNHISHLSSNVLETLKRARTTVRDSLKRLIEKNLVERPFGHGYKLTDKGLKYYEEIIKNSGGGFSRGGWREGRTTTSTHRFNFYSNIATKPENIITLGELDKKVIKLNNNLQYLYYFKDITIKITNKKVFFYVADQIGNSYDEAQFKGMNIISKYIKLLDSKGIKLKDLIVEDELHFASINNVFGNWISKHNDRFLLDLGDDIKLWVDNSHGTELESNDPELMGRFQDLAVDLKETEHRLRDIGDIKQESINNRDDIDKLIVLTKNLVKISNNLVMSAVQEPVIKERPKYIN